MHKRTRIAASTALACLVLAGAACSSENSASTSTSTSTSSATLPQSFQVDTADGQVSLSLDGKLPPGWPKDFPVPASAQPAGSGSLGTSTDSTLRVGVYTTGDPGDSVLDFYSNDPDLVTTGRKGAGLGDNFAGRIELTSPYTGSVTVVSRQGNTYLVVTLKGEQPAPTTSTTGAGATTTTPTTTAAADMTPQ